jgi:hypothetical protein
MAAAQEPHLTSKILNTSAGSSLRQPPEQNSGFVHSRILPICNEPGSTLWSDPATYLRFSVALINRVYRT